MTPVTIYAVFESRESVGHAEVAREVPGTRTTIQAEANAAAARLGPGHYFRALTEDEKLRLRRIDPGQAEPKTADVKPAAAPGAWTKLVDLAAELGVDPPTLRHRAKKLGITGRAWRKIGGPGAKMGGLATVLTTEECDRLREELAANPVRGNVRATNKRQTFQALKRAKAADAVRAADLEHGKNEVKEFRLAANENPPTGGVCSVCRRPVAEHHDGEACWHPTIGTDAPGKLDDDFTGAPAGLDGRTPDPHGDWPDGFGPAPAAAGSRSPALVTLVDLANRLDRVQVDLSRLGAAVRALTEPQPEDEDVLIKMRQPVSPGQIAQICGAIAGQVVVHGDGEWMTVRRWRGGDA